MKLRIKEDNGDNEGDNGYIDAINANKEPCNEITVEVKTLKSNKTGNTFEAIELHIGEWNTLVFPRTRFELNYIKSVLNA